MTSSAAELDQRSGNTRTVPASAVGLTVGRVSAATALVLCVLLQYLNDDFFPPQISVSQYGIGPRGWLFTSWTAVTALAVLALNASGPVHVRWAAHWLLVGSVGLLVMGIVRTDAGGLQHSWHAKVHMVASIVALIAVPFGMAVAMNWTRIWWRRVAWTLVAASSASLIMVVVSAGGVAIPGMTGAQSWALWQSVAVTLDMILVGIFALAGLSSPAGRRPGRRGTDGRAPQSRR